MSIQSQYNIQAILTEDLLYSQQFASLTSTTSPARVTSTTLVSGTNTIVLPAGTSGFGIIPPVSNTTVDLTLKGVTGDTGVPLGASNPSIFGIKTTTATTQVVVNASGTLADVTLIVL